MLDTQKQKLVTIVLYMFVWLHPLPILTHTLFKYY